MASNTNQRQTHFVDRTVQGAILLRILAHWALFLFAAGVFLFFIELLAGDPRDAGKNLLSRHGPTVLAILVLAPILIRDLCRLTNRFAGPIVRLRRAMHDLAEGREVSPIHFRERDFWKDLAIDFNRVVERVQSTKAVGENDWQELAITSGAPEDA